jgi:hypothetical protein
MSVLLLTIVRRVSAYRPFHYLLPSFIQLLICRYSMPGVALVNGYILGIAVEGMGKGRQWMIEIVRYQ